MKYPCNLIQDLLPLYHDGVCSEESINIVENHLSECSVCRESYTYLRENGGIITVSSNADQELKKAASFRSVRKKLLRKQIFIVIIVFCLLTIIVLAAIGVLKNSAGVIDYKDNISVSMTDGSLIGRLRGSQANYLKIKRIEITADEKESTYLFFCMSDTKWDDITTSNAVFSEYVLCPEDKGAEQIDAVYYYTGEYTGIENMSEAALQEIINSSVLLWSK